MSQLRMVEPEGGVKWLHSSTVATLQIERSSPLVVNLDELGLEQRGFTVRQLKQLLEVCWHCAQRLMRRCRA